MKEKLRRVKVIKPIPVSKYARDTSLAVTGKRVRYVPQDVNVSAIVSAINRQTDALKGIHKTLEGLTITQMQIARMMQEDSGFDSFG